jgi:AcrR family transcriptional regulator
MKVSSETRSDRRRAAIIDAARACFFVTGYGGTSMSSIAKLLGGSKGTLYAYFKTKDELFEAVVQRSCAELEAAMFDVDPREQAPEEVLARFALGLARHLLRPESLALQRLVIGEGERVPALGQIFYARGPSVVLGRVADYLQGLIAEGRLRMSDPRVAAQHFADLTVSSINWRRLCGFPDADGVRETEGQVAAAVAVFLRAYAPDPAGGPGVTPSSPVGGFGSARPPSPIARLSGRMEE